MALVPTERLQPPANESMLGPNGQLTQAWQQHFQRLSDQTKTLSDELHTGTTTDDDAEPGMVGEYLTATASVALAAGAAADVVVLALTAGDWEVAGTVSFAPAGNTVPVRLRAGIGTASTAFGAVSTDIQGTAALIGAVLATTFARGPAVHQIGTGASARVSLAASASVYLVGYASYFLAATLGAGGSLAASGIINARRAR